MRRYGFHGLSYEYIASVLPAFAPEAAAGATVVAHLGNGSSMCAIAAGKSVASTMGFTAVDGLPMGTRCGNLDPGVILYLMDELKMDARAIENLIYKQSGLLGVSGMSSDMRALLGSDDAHARFAVDLFVYRIGRELGSLAAAMQGIDALVFTAGIGEHSAAIRERVCRAGALARRGARPGRQRGRRAAHQHAGQQGLRVGHPDQRRTDDRAPYAQGDRSGAAMKTIALEQAVAMIPDGASVMIGGFMGVGTPERLMDEVARQGKRDLTVIANDTAMPGCGIGKLVDAGTVRKAIVSHIGLNPETQKKMIAGEMEVELVPQGTLIERIRAGGFGLGGILTPTGVGTLVEAGQDQAGRRWQALPAGDGAACRFRAGRGLPVRLLRQPGLRADGAQFQPGDRDGRHDRDRRRRPYRPGRDDLARPCRDAGRAGRFRRRPLEEMPP